MNDVLALQVVECQCHLTEVEFDSILAELDTLLQVVAQITSQQEVHHHKHILLILEWVPETGEGGRRTQCSLTVQCGKQRNKHLLYKDWAHKHTQYRDLNAAACKYITCAKRTW